MKNNKNNKGFTLLETIVAVTVLVTAIIGPFSLASQTIKAQSIAKNNLIAANLAQEGIELIRNYRANNVLLHGGDLAYWLDGMGDESANDACWSLAGCNIDVFSIGDSSLAVCPSGGCPLYLDEGTGLYSHKLGSTKTKFTRTINLRRISAQSATDPDEIKATATIRWSDGVGSDQFVVSTHLLNW